MAGERRRAAVIGHPIAHSRSPQMHNAGYAELGLDWRYEAVDVAPEGLERFVRGLPDAGFAGINVTIPHKQAVLAFCDLVAPEATAAGSVNTIVVGNDGRLIGHSTDGRGLLWALGGISPSTALVLGSGGAARAAVHELKAAGWTVMVSARSRQAAHELGAEPQHWPPPQAAPLVVNATPIGQAWDPAQMPIAPWLIEPGSTVCDLAYGGDGRPSMLISAAAARGARVVDGLDVLVGQGILAFELLTGQTAPVEVMRSAARA
jgi:shikimate dehydrogenase